MMPDWAQTCALVRRGAMAFAQLPLLGWDVAPSADGVVIIEANSNPDIIGAQICCGQGARALLGPLWRA
jgi:glutathione synthase/RimK-type ligase-like ATP-grasp enzyme